MSEVKTNKISSVSTNGDITLDPDGTGDTIIASGNVGIGTTSPSRFVHLEDGTDTTLHLTTSSTGSTGSDGTSLFVDGTAASLWQRENDYLRFATNNTERLRILAGGGLTFNGDTATANALDDYEEGDFTPELRASTTNPSSTISGVGKYTKIGRTVTFNFIFSNKTISGAAGNIQIINMPFAPTGAINAIFPIASHNMNSPGTFSVGYLTGGGTTMEVLNMRDATSWQNVNISNVSAFYLFVGGSYTTSS